MTQHTYREILSPEQDVFDGLLFIPDISGFTELVHSTDVQTGKQITCELLSAIINENILEMEIAEIEGDAVLFYRNGVAPGPRQLFQQYEKMTISFEAKCKELQRKFSMPLNLSLKVIAHYGPMSDFKINSFKKLYGEVVVEAHRLLKNSIDSNSYLLLTDSLFKRPHSLFDDELLQHGIRSNKLCEVYGGLRNICFTYFDFSERRSRKLVA
ncbi:MAG TPA: DUF2652 domain-containing protein [Chitinophagaceae bacterium]